MYKTCEFGLMYPSRLGFLKEGMAIAPIFLAGESHGQRNLAGSSPYGWKQSDRTEVT